MISRRNILPWNVPLISYLYNMRLFSYLFTCAIKNKIYSELLASFQLAKGYIHIVTIYFFSTSNFMQVKWLYIKKRKIANENFRCDNNRRKVIKYILYIIYYFAWPPKENFMRWICICIVENRKISNNFDG